MDLAELGARIRSQREKCRLTQAQLANSLMITAQAVSKWERGDNAPDIIQLKPLAQLLGVSIDWILSGQDNKDTFEATVFCSSLRNFASRSSQMSPKDVARWINGIFHTLTESVLAHNGVPVKYVGDGFLAYFTGYDQASRTISAAQDAERALDDDNLLITLHRGQIYLGTIGHHEYARPDIMGETVNSVFMMNQWATANSNARLIVSETVPLEGGISAGGQVAGLELFTL